MPAAAMSRRLLRAGSVCFALPLRESLGAKEPAPSVRRFVCVANPFGMLREDFFPAGEGAAAELTGNLAPLEKPGGRFTVFSNLDHGTNRNHGPRCTFLFGVRSADAATMPDGNITLDQFLGHGINGKTRLPVLSTATAFAAHKGRLHLMRGVGVWPVSGRTSP
jgi:hypothetical protein